MKQWRHLYLDKLKANLEGRSIDVIELPDGEAFKTVETAFMVIDKLVAGGANRDTTVIALGGGVVGDIAGFAAACYMRGVAFVQVPTTLLAQVDSSVGGKTGVNHSQGKNLIGAFHQPQVVLIDTASLGTLPERELRAGLAEVIKHGVIADTDFFAWLEQNIAALLALETDAVAHAVQRSCEIKAEIVAEDERESGRRAILNFGHTFGHAIEHCQGYGEWLHGEAVAAGMVMAAQLSGIDAGDQQRLRGLIEAAGLPCSPPAMGHASHARRHAHGQEGSAKKAATCAARTVRPGNSDRRVRSCSAQTGAGSCQLMTALAPYAASEAQSRGRRYDELAATYRGEYQRDRDRIIHSTAFRRLVYKTQVFVNHEGDLYRTRLTHSLEVSQVGRSVASALSLNEPLTEAICLAHDLGHTPFGHAGQDELNDCMREFGGFEHNLQSLRVVDELEAKYAEFPGLNLMFETREGILKHCSKANARELGDVGRRFLIASNPGSKHR